MPSVGTNRVLSSTARPADPLAERVDEATAFTLDEAAARLRVNRETVARLVRAGKLRTVASLGRVRRIAFGELRRFIEAIETPEAATASNGGESMNGPSAEKQTAA